MEFWLHRSRGMPPSWLQPPRLHSRSAAPRPRKQVMLGCAPRPLERRHRRRWCRVRRLRRSRARSRRQPSSSRLDHCLAPPIRLWISPLPRPCEAGTEAPELLNLRSRVHEPGSSPGRNARFAPCKRPCLVKCLRCLRWIPTAPIRCVLDRLLGFGCLRLVVPLVPRTLRRRPCDSTQRADRCNRRLSPGSSPWETSDCRGIETWRMFERSVRMWMRRMERAGCGTGGGLRRSAEPRLLGCRPHPRVSGSRDRDRFRTAILL